MSFERKHTLSVRVGTQNYLFGIGAINIRILLFPISTVLYSQANSTIHGFNSTIQIFNSII